MQCHADPKIYNPQDNCKNTAIKNNHATKEDERPTTGLEKQQGKEAA
jgi:hypothetical protein